MTREIRKEEIWSALEAEGRRAQSQGESPAAASEAQPVVIEAAAPSAPADGETPSGQSQPPPEPSTLNAVDAPAPAEQADGDTQAPPSPVDLEAVEPSEPRETDDAAIARLAAMGQLDYDRVRRQEAEALGVTLQALDAEVRTARARQTPTNDGTPFADPAPWPEPLDPAELLDEIAGVIRKHVVLDEAQVIIHSLWIVHTYMLELFEVSPLALFTAPEKASGKSTAQALVARVCHRPLLAANASPSSIFRAAEKWGPTLLIDEADTFFRDRPELHGLVNAGYSRGGFVLRTEPAGDGFEPRAYSVYCAKSIAGNNLERHLPDATMSRGHVLGMRRKLPAEKVARLRDADPALFERIRAKIVRFKRDYEQQLRSARPKLPDELSDRAADNWAPLVAIASCAGPSWVERALAAALKLSGPGESQASIGGQLLEDIWRIFDRWRGDKISTADLIEELCRDEERPRATYNRGKQVTPRQLARLLSAYGIWSRTVRMSASRTPKGYIKADFEEAFARYLPPPEQQRPSRGPEVIDPAEPGDWPDRDDFPDP